MTPLITIFLDGLKPASLKHMPFLASLPYQGRMKTLMGYSVACHASMYTGVYPDKHLLWFIWKTAPKTSPHRWLRYVPFPIFLNNLPAKYFLTKTARLFYRPTAFFGVPYIVHLPVKYWNQLDIAEKKFWTEPNYLDSVPSLFDHLRTAGVDFEIAGMIRGASRTADAIDRHEFGDLKPWTYLFVGDIDGLSHAHTQESEYVISELKRIDRILECKVSQLKEKTDNVHILAFSDHGHMPVTRKIDPYQYFRNNGENLNNYLHIIDANFLRMWFKSPQDEQRIMKLLENLDGGWMLDNDQLQKYHLTMPDTRFGELIYYLDAPSVFSRTIWGWSRSINSMHGYSPDHPDMDGFIASDIQFDTESHRHLVDIMPTILSALNLPVPEGLDGRII